MTTPKFTVADIRKTFLDFFESKGHTVVASSPLVPGNDPTLMFTNSGMVQFKDVFLGEDKRSYVRAASVQACLRAGGKHNDLENVGYTARHHTFFEMLGNWSFGDYFKRESLKWAWELLTEVYKLPADRLLATVYQEDDEAYDIWTKEIGLPPERVIRIGDNKGGRYKSDNFWMMADTGPCGPCSEIFYDHGDHIPGGPPGSPDEDGDRFIEIWNNVFMQFNMAEDGSVTRLPAPCVDTGMGLERLAAILQHVHSNYEIDIFDALIKAAARETGCQDLGHKSLRVIADHIRATSFLVSDGVVPSNEGRGYVQRRIIRRAIRHGYLLGQKKPFFHKLVPDLVKLMGDAYPNMASQAERIASVLKAEEERFFETLEVGMSILDAALQGGAKVLPGEVAFKLHDTYGFPLDLSADVCRERGLSVDEAGFAAAMEKQKSQARAAGKFKMDKALEYTGAGNAFVGYDDLKATSKVVAVYLDGNSVAELKHGQSGVVVLDTTPFYAESGGQVGDAGVLVSGSASFAVEDTLKIKADVYGHHGTLTQGTLAVGDHVDAQVDTQLRAATVRNHSATHLMHKALREVLGDHVQQKGSLVNAERTRFDFAHNAPVTDAQIREIEAKVNAEILANAAAQARVMDIESAQKTGAMMLFGEKYGETVRVLDIGSSRELCGGTHVKATGDIGLFKVVAEGGVAAGVRRIEAVTGANALAYLQSLEDSVAQAAGALKAPPTELNARLAQVLEQVKTLEKEVSALKGKVASAQSDELLTQAVDIKGTKLLVAKLEGADAKTLRDTMDKLKDKMKSAVIVLAAVDGEKVNIAAGVTADNTGKVKAGEMANFVAQQVGGKGGGKPDMAMAGGTDAAALPKALASVQAWVTERL
ncbi:MAG: alanine--tRNA ligase [Burkholderiales bacterium 35-55-47]|jgi:alanyl-tRNA synthetase|uniref:alanine--tRNA ligase n=1 Tax=Limnohabitans sp. TaxID=1907725 RepID=UPI000BC57BFB|nr:alanine--tRNA ligase [Limnohabitans sp.]OYY19872.1 MAG: alanine--tRNA ligase [Burkholderiales bacterium 35-55-47]OYZ74517.1 MAG: alanine--tRNA ligase [Burkholderiales bacterium 24-55-52]OZB01594.1 MAG: alanine--tRNA ligase [Burkholderiales bacterium 39-55-53]HQR86081.1 alanine--tRNA ligase [Limnohabitans sp.]HQS26003.1 alanine--tRNA ligase [Limnohabitans sp.]